MQQLFLLLFKGPVAWLPLQNKVLYICVDEGRDFLKQKLSGGNVNGDRSIVKLLRASETAHISYNGRMSSLLTALIDARPKGTYGLKLKKKGIAFLCILLVSNYGDSRPGTAKMLCLEAMQYVLNEGKDTLTVTLHQLSRLLTCLISIQSARPAVELSEY